ncbi:hypothetical protein HQ585_20470 [candidate division KSB1 bacterium]|nr:hypothetical protein [candidate division KSB1 bacterium]
MKTRGVGELGEKQWNAPQESDIQNARMVVLDPYFRDESRAAARMCPT